jgi:hypothetical protein
MLLTCDGIIYLTLGSFNGMIKFPGKKKEEIKFRNLDRSTSRAQLVSVSKAQQPRLPRPARIQLHHRSFPTAAFALRKLLETARHHPSSPRKKVLLQSQRAITPPPISDRTLVLRECLLRFAPPR